MSANPPYAVLFGVSGHTLTPNEVVFLRQANPFGFILFGRNIDTPDQVRGLCDQLRSVVGRTDAPILIDQEGGRVSRLKPPHWRPMPPADIFGALYRKNPEVAMRAAFLNARLIAADLQALGIDTDCLPVLDIRFPSAHDIVGDRAFSEDANVVSELGNAVMNGLLEGGVYPVIKHIPGHGRALADSHTDLPIIDTPLQELEKTDFVPFRMSAHAPFAMTAHIVYSRIDPEHPATLSKKVISDVIRGTCRFDNLLMSDDLSMNALDGSMKDRAENSLRAGCDLVLHCNGEMGEMEAVMEGARQMDGDAMRRWSRVKVMRHNAAVQDVIPLLQELSEISGWNYQIT